MRSEVIVGYKTYIDLIGPEFLEGKEVISTGMKGEIQRCQLAIEKALDGRDTALVSSGDAGVYGMAGLVLELLAEYGLLDLIELEVIPGIPALCAAAALLGAPLMDDFAVISLSDLMTQWEVIQERVESAARGDFVIVLYNPRSRKRDWQLSRVRDIVLSHRDRDTPVGIVRNAARDGEAVQITTLAGMDESPVDMLSIIFIGNSRTRVARGRMITSRGYFTKYDLPPLGHLATSQ